MRPGQRTEPGADLDAEIVEQLAAHRGLVDTVGDAHRVERPEPFRCRRQQLKVERGEPFGEQQVVGVMPRVTVAEAFFLDHAHRFVQREDQRR